ncbi:MAG: peptidase M23 [Gemmatimonas sp.]|nr:peptidase M23 [Gemmatimonas sp.]
MLSSMRIPWGPLSGPWRQLLPGGAVLIGLGQPASVPAQPRPATACHFASLQLTPETAVAGTLVRLAWPRNALPDTATQATLAGERLHLRPVGDSVVALAAVPIDSSQGITLSLTCRAAGGALFQDSLRLRTSAGTYRLERLRVAPRFGAPPDSALAARQAAEAARAAAVSRAAHDTPRLFDRPFRAPRPSRITSGFGSGRQFNGTVTSRHMGTDYAGATGAPVYAANRGVVRLVDRFYLGGNVVYVDHGEGLVTAYLHLSRARVAEGDTVARGQRLGDVGATGRVTGPHLHFIARFGQITVDPKSLIGRGAR